VDQLAKLADLRDRASSRPRSSTARRPRSWPERDHNRLRQQRCFAAGGLIIDIFRSHDLSGWAKALWFIFILFLPLIGVLVHLIARGGKMHEHAVRQAR